MEDKIKTPKYAKKYECIKCNFICSKLSDFNRHILTNKHNKIIKDNEKAPKNATRQYICNCGKEYKYSSGLSKHKKLCNGNKDEMKDLVFKLIKQNTELQQQISELIPKVGNNHNTINSNNKNKFNINVFLNEKCKDALSMDEFIDKIEVSMKNLLTTKEKGQTYGISNIIIENINKLSLYERPIHCTDKKRETLYVKNNIWEKDDSKEHINKALKKVESKQLKNLNVWLEEHPNYMNNSREQEEFAKLMSECGKSVDDGREKIIKKLCDNVYLEKIDES